MLFRKRNTNKNRACLLGLDGVPIGLLQRLTAEGVMPRTAAILQGGTLRAMRASLPPVSSVSWSSFMTGANPGVHGIFGFTDVDSATYKLRFPTFADLACPTLWDRLGEAGLRSCVINQPSTYPARKIPGALLAGFVAPDFVRSIFPPELVPPLRSMGYRIDVDTQHARENPDSLLDDLDATLAARRQAALWLWEREAWDCFELVITGTDRLHHFLWRAVVDADDPRHARAMRFYTAVDALVGELWDRFHAGRSADTEGEGFLLLSDHGFTGLRKEVRLNAWLREQGYLRYRTDDPTTVADLDPAATRAFVLDPGRIYLNRTSRFPHGPVSEEEAAPLAAELTARLQSLTYEGQPVIAHLFPRAQAFSGTKTDAAPDLVLVGHPGFDLKGTTRGAEIFTDTHFQGMHTWDDALVWTTLPLPQTPEIADLAGPIMGHLGL